ncbi:MAG: right-handed parallel beta-helix repeat-containing protein [Candidatus Latescibacterota bacterium]
MEAPFRRTDLFVSPKGNDSWSGSFSEPNAEGTDGPLATIGKARDRVRERKLSGKLSGPVAVWIRGGRYAISEPLLFGPEDSAPVTYAAYPGEQPIVDGGRPITGWQVEEVHGIPCWVAEIPEVAAGTWYFRQLFVDGKRRRRSRLPKEGFYWMESVPETHLSSELFEGSDAFVSAPGDIRSWKNLTDIEIVALHWWVDERMPIVSFDETTRLVRSSRRSIFALRDDQGKQYARYRVEHVFEALSEPGEWYLDRAAGKVTYIPMPGEDPETTEVFAPVVEKLLKLAGQPEAGRYVEFLRFEGLCFRHTDWRQPGGGFDADTEGGAPKVDYASAPQAASNIPGVLFLEGARYCSIENCTVEHIGGYGIEMAGGCMANRLVGNTLCDLGAGGIKWNGSDAHGPAALRTGNHTVTDNHICQGGRVFHSAVGILSVHSFGNDISHNHIHDLYYTGISCGWVWGYGPSVSRDNLIEKNHIHDLGHGLLSDMGGIYTLGVQPGTVIRGNVIHDVEKRNYGGWAIYPDEGSSHILIEHNVCYNTSSQSFHQHYGRENIVRNNLFAFGREGQVALGRGEAHHSFTFERNLVLTDGQPLFLGGYAYRLEDRGYSSDLNLFWDVSGESLVEEMAERRKLGYDLHAIIADPGCRDLDAYDFTLLADSPAFALGFRPIDVSDVGLRPKNERG